MNAGTPSSIGEVDSSSVSVEKKPVVVVLGWSSSQDRFVRKYCQIYEDLGCVTIRHNPPASHAFFNYAPNREKAVELLQLIANLKGSSQGPKRFIVHLISNGGAFVYSELIKILDSSQSEIQKMAHITDTPKLVGTIYDSAPTPPTLISGLHVVYDIMGSLGISLIFKLAGSFLFLVLMICLKPLSYLIPHLIRIERTRQKLMQVLSRDASRCPQMFLYSMADKICPAKIIEEFANQRQKLGVEVTQKCWKDSEHCMHLVRHREEYLQYCHQFCKKVFTDQ